MFGFSFGGGGSKTTNTQTNSLDDNTKNQLGSIWNARQQAGLAGPSPLLTGAAGFGSNAQGAGNLGMGALAGDPRMMGQLMNPYTQQVIGANNALWQKTNAQTANQVADRATQAGAFGSSRYGVALGTALSNNNINQQAQTAGLLSQGYTNAQGVAGQLAGLGFQGAGLNSNLGMAGVGSPSQWYANQLQQGYIQPTGSTTGTTTSNVNANGGFKFGF